MSQYHNIIICYNTFGKKDLHVGTSSNINGHENNGPSSPVTASIGTPTQVKTVMSLRSSGDTMSRHMKLVLTYFQRDAG